MPDVAWRLDARFANLSCGPLAAGVDLFTPCLGLTGLRWCERPLAGWQILGVEIESLDGLAAGTLVEKYVRGGDLVATYEPTPARPFGVQIYWRAALSQLDGQALPVVTLQVSVQTKLPDCQPALTTAGLLPECESVELGDALARANAPVRRLFRPSKCNVSYAQSVDHEGLERNEFTTFSDGTWRLATRLFGGAMEKGVILRTSVRGVFLPRNDDELLAALAFEDFAKQPPPLTT
jgi:hypothetical protein